MQSTVDLIKAHIQESTETKLQLSAHCLEQIALAGHRLAEAIKHQHTVFACGNGGSASDAQHFAAELVGRFESERASLPALALTTDSSAITAIGNDYGFDELFARQLAGLGRAGDILIAISTSGQSANIIKAIERAHQKDMKVILLTGRDGGAALSLCQGADTSIKVPSYRTMRIQEAHILILHCLCDIIDQQLFPTQHQETTLKYSSKSPI